MLGSKFLSVAVGTLGCVLLAATASADEFTDSVAAIHRAMVGHWSGDLSGTDASGERFDVEDDYMFVVTSEDGLDYATWSSDTLQIATYEGDGLYRIRDWNQTGRQNEILLQMRIVEDPGVSGNGAWMLELEQTASDGTVMETQEHFTLDQDTLRMIIEMRPVDSDEPFETTVIGMWARETN